MEKSIKYGLFLSILFLCIISFFAFELPNLQRILSLNIYIFCSVILSIISCYFLTKKINSVPNIKERIAMIGFVFVLLLLFWISVPSLINRSITVSSPETIAVDKIKLEWTSMFGMTADEKRDLKATHVRILFTYKEKSFSRAFLIGDIEMERIEENEVNVFKSRGLLGFDIIK